MTAEQFWATLFGRPGAVEIEIGSGKGAFLFAVAAAAPQRNFFAIEHSSSRATALADQAQRRGLHNIRVLHADATCLIGALVPSHSVAAYHILFPDPWWKRRHHRRRLFTADFVAALARTLVPGGAVDVATDVDAYFALMTKLLAVHFARDCAPVTWPIVTRFEQKARARGATIHRARFRKLTPA